MYFGKVIGVKSAKTLKVQVCNYKKHPIYKKYILKKNLFLVHCDSTFIKINNFIEFSYLKPFSKNKYYLFNKIIK